MTLTNLTAAFETLDKLHFNRLLGENGWHVRFGCLHGGPRQLPRTQREIRKYAFHRRIWGITIPSPLKQIFLDERLLAEPPALRMVLLHEMVHAHLLMLKGAGPEVVNNHGPLFVNELLRLVMRGEECLRPDFEYYGRRLRSAGLSRALSSSSVAQR